MDNLSKWILGIELDKIVSFEELKKIIVEHGKRDYLFFPFLIGYVSRYINDNSVKNTLKDMTLFCIYDLLKEGLINVYFVNSTEMTLVKWRTNEDLNSILSEIKEKWDNCEDKEPEMNEILWITA